MRSSSSSTSVSSTEIVSFSTIDRSAKSTFAERSAASRSSPVNDSGSWPVICIHVSRFMPCPCSRIASCCSCSDISPLTIESGTGSSTRAASAAAVFSRIAALAWKVRIIFMRWIVSVRSSSTDSCSVFSSTHSSLSSGSTSSLTEFTFISKSMDTSSCTGWSALKLSSSPGLAPSSWLSTSSTIPPLPME